jgi:hypothetical protein
MCLRAALLMRVVRQQFFAQNSDAGRRGYDESHLLVLHSADSDHQLLAAQLADEFFVGAFRVDEEVNGFDNVAAQQQVSHGDSLVRWRVGLGDGLAAAASLRWHRSWQ